MFAYQMEHVYASVDMAPRVLPKILRAKIQVRNKHEYPKSQIQNMAWPDADVWGFES